MFHRTALLLSVSLAACTGLSSLREKCSTNAQCDEGTICRFGTCRFECEVDNDCPRAEDTCAFHRCISASQPEVAVSSDGACGEDAESAPDAGADAGAASTCDALDPDL